MKTLKVLLLLCWSSLALMIGGPFSSHYSGVARMLQTKQTVTPGHSMDQSVNPHSSLMGTNSQGHGPWLEQVTGLPSGTRVWNVHAVDSNTVWALATGSGSYWGRIYIRTTNGGRTWTSDTISIAPASYLLTGIYAFDADTAWATMWNSSENGGGIFRTTNGGVTWTQVPNAYKDKTGGPALIHFFDSRNGVCVGDANVWKLEVWYLEIYTTSDGGTSWERVPEANVAPFLGGWEWPSPGLFSAAKNSLWFPTGGGGSGSWTGRYYRTTDRGLTWTAHSYPGISPARYPAFAFQNDSVGLGNGAGGEVSRTTDGGSTWERISSPSYLRLGSLEYVPGTSGMYVGRAYWEYPDLEADGLWRTTYTTDAGASWVVACPQDGSGQLDFVSASAGWRGGDGPNIFKWTMGQGRVVGISMDSLMFKTLEVGQRSDTIAIDAVNFGSELLTVSSVSLPGADFAVIRQPSLPATIPPFGFLRIEICLAPTLAGTIRDSLVVNSDAPQTPRTTVALMGKGFLPQAADSNVLYAASGSLFSITSDSGLVTRIDTLDGAPLYGLAIQPGTHELYGVSSTATSTTVYRINSANAMALPVSTFSVGDIRGISFLDNNTLYAASTDGKIGLLNIATGGMVSFATTTLGISYRGVAVGPDGTLWLSGSDSQDLDNIYTFDEDLWEAVLVGRTGDNTLVSSIVFDAQGNLYGLKGAGTDTSSIVSIDIHTAAGTDVFRPGIEGVTAITVSGAYTFPAGGIDYREGTGVPRVFALEQNYPNPFNPRTVVRSQLPVVSNVKLIVYDVLGREVAMLVNERRAPGYYQDTFDATGLSSGIYFYKLIAGSFVETKKALLIK
jgi:hypothetical protein